MTEVSEDVTFQHYGSTPNCHRDLQPRSLKLRVLSLGLFQDGNVLVGVSPQGEEILIGSTGFVGMPLQCVCAGEAEMGEYEERVVRDHGGVGEKFLKLCCRFGTLMEKQIRLPANVHGIKIGPKFDVRHLAQFVRSCGLEKLDGLGGVTAVDFNGCSDGWQPIIADDASR
jgi:hypothetical protein